MLGHLARDARLHGGQHARAHLARLVADFQRLQHGGKRGAEVTRGLAERVGERTVPVFGLTGTGGAGKSSVLDELLRRLTRDAPEAKIALLLVDPTRRRSGGALLGDRIRLNAVGSPNVFVRSLATRQANLALSQAVTDSLVVFKAAGFDLVFDGADFESRGLRLCLSHKTACTLAAFEPAFER